MKVMLVSKALVSATYRRKLVELAKAGADVIAVVPPEWREGGGVQRLEPASDSEYELVITPIRWNGHFHLHYFPQLPRILRQTRPDILHVDEEPYNLATYLAVRTARQAAVPSLFFSWQNLLRRYPPPFHQMERYVYRTVSHALAGTEEVACVLRRKGYERPLSVVPQFGVDPNDFSPGPQPKGAFTIGFLNRLIPAKAPLLTLEAFSRLPQDARLCIVGDGPLRHEVATEIARRNLAGRAELLGRVPSGRMPDLIRHLHVVVLPSITTPSWKEQFGRTLIEAMACGIPVVGSDSGEIPRVVGNAGLIVPEGDAQALTNALRRLYDDPQLRAELGRRGRRRILEHFTHAHVASLTYAAYTRALSG